MVWSKEMKTGWRIPIGVVSGVLGLIAVGAAHAASPVIENAKDQCIIGEQNDGYLGFVDGADGDANLRREVRSVNQQRKAAYSNLARRNGVTIDDAARATAERLINSAGSGECVQDASGDWIEL